MSHRTRPPTSRPTPKSSRPAIDPLFVHPRNSARQGRRKVPAESYPSGIEVVRYRKLVDGGRDRDLSSWGSHAIDSISNQTD